MALAQRREPKEFSRGRPRYQFQMVAGLHLNLSRAGYRDARIPEAGDRMSDAGGPGSSTHLGREENAEIPPSSAESFWRHRATCRPLPGPAGMKLEGV